MPAGGIITRSCPNTDGQMCLICGQIAFKIATVEINGKGTEVPVCGQHYLETLKRSPVTKRVVTDCSPVQ
jgi:hypothetical protein